LQIGTDLSLTGFTQTGGALTVTGQFNADGSFIQSAGSLAAGGINILQSSGNLTLSSLKSPIVKLSAPAGAISQTGPIVSGELITLSLNGTILNGPGNEISRWTGENLGVGNIELTNTGVLKILGIKNARGSIRVVNTGGVETVGAIKARGGSISIKANSPLTVGLEGLSGDGDIELVATNLTSAGNIVLNGPLESTSGAVTITAANNFTQNSSIKAPLGVSANAGGTLTMGPLATSGFMPVTYVVASTPVTPPAGALSPASDMVVAMLTGTTVGETPAAQQAQAAANIPVKDKDKEKGTSKESVVAEGGICRP
jgi:hypothetical protein